jgi:hypothetical protein
MGEQSSGNAERDRLRPIIARIAGRDQHSLSFKSSIRFWCT